METPAPASQPAKETPSFAMLPVNPKTGFPDFTTKTQRLAWFKLKLSQDANWAMRACEVVYQYQTASEKAAQATTQDNGVGFSGTDAELLSSFAQQIAKNRAAKAAGTFPKNYGLLSPKQTALVLKRMPKYASQLISHLEASGKLPALAKKVNTDGSIGAAA